MDLMSPQEDRDRPSAPQGDHHSPPSGILFRWEGRGAVVSRSREFWPIILTIAIIGTITWLAIVEHNYHPRIYRYNEQVTGDHARALKIVS